MMLDVKPLRPAYSTLEEVEEIRSQLIPNPYKWDKREYLFIQALGEWKKVNVDLTAKARLEARVDEDSKPIISYVPEEKELQKQTLKLALQLQELADNIINSRRYSLIYQYLLYAEEIYLANLKKGQEISFEDRAFFLHCLTTLLVKVCCRKGKLLAGVSEFPLWVPIPDNFKTTLTLSDYSIIVDWLEPAPIMIFFGQYLTGDQKQQHYDRLLVPAPDRWKTRDFFDNWQDFELTLAASLGYSGHVTKKDYEEVLAHIWLERHYTLVPNRPIVVKLENHSLIRQLTLMQKGDTVLARIETYNCGDLVNAFSLNDPDCSNTLLEAYRIMNDEFAASYFFAIPTFIAQVYRDLVVLDTIVTNVDTNNQPSLLAVTANDIQNASKTRKKATNNPKKQQIVWKCLPRKMYLKTPLTTSNAETTVEREALSQEALHKQTLVKRYHEVCGHVRCYHHKEKWFASTQRQELARADGIILHEGETYVRPHARGKAALATLENGNLDIKQLPHYLWRGKLLNEDKKKRGKTK